MPCVKPDAYKEFVDMDTDELFYRLLLAAYPLHKAGEPREPKKRTPRRRT